MAVIDFDELLPEARVKILSASQAKSRNAVLKLAAHNLEESTSPPSGDAPTLDHRVVLQGLVERELLGSTAFEELGAAIPHCRLESCAAPTAALLRLPQPVDFSGAAVRLIFVLVVPAQASEAHLEVLRIVARVLENGVARKSLLDAEDEKHLHAQFHTLVNELQA